MIAQSLEIEVGLQGKQQLARDWGNVVKDFREGSKDVTTAAQGTSRAARDVQTSAQRTAAAMRSGTAAAETLRGGFRNASGAARGLKTELDGVATSGSRVGEVFKGALGAQVVAGGLTRATSAAIDFVRGSVDAVLQGQRIGRSLKFAAGGAEEGASEFRFIKGESERLGLQLNITAASYSKLAAAAQGTELQGRATREIFTGVAEAATVLSLSSDETAGAINALQQMMSKGTVQAEELRGQLGERIPGAFQMAARAMNVTTQQLSKMLEQGEVMAADFLPRFARELHKTFGKEAVSASSEGQAGINRFKTALFELSAGFGTGFMVGVSATLSRLRELFTDESFKSKVKELGTTFGSALSSLVDNFGAVVTAGKAFFAMFAVGKLAAIVTGIRSMGLALAAVVATNPILAALTVTVGVATIAYDQAKKASRSWHDELKEGEAALKRYNPELDNLENKVKKLHAAVMAADPFANIAADAGNAANRSKADKLSDDQVKTLAKLQEELAQARVNAITNSFERERAAENLAHQKKMAGLRKFNQGTVIERQRHAQELANIAAKENEELAKEGERAGKELFQKVQERDKQKEALRLAFREKEMEAEQRIQDVRDALETDGLSRQKSQLTAHYKEMEEAVTLYARTTAEKEELLTRLHRQESEARKRIDREEMFSRMETGLTMASNLLKAWDTMYSGARKNALLHKSLAVGMILADTGVAVMKTLAQGGFLAMPQAILVGAMGAAAAYKASQQKFAHGGVVQGPYTSGDRIPVRANAGEMILTQAQQAQLFALANGGGNRGSGNTYEINYRPSYQISGSVSSMATRDLISAIDRDKSGFSRYWRTEIVEKGFA